MDSLPIFWSQRDEDDTTQEEHCIVDRRRRLPSDREGVLGTYQTEAFLLCLGPGAHG
jgi:hypothetical protein